ncbi:MAG: beta-galactosidase [Actinomycetaceae bacterium]|nr:beta-galactosidase [Arcanobacterium sp.]MDD7504960.1 beta-galactosidase [Actinomycetaceae bacterium]MDY6143711.1 beta-galactosidase [Arcanobacterium sp.]
MGFPSRALTAPHTSAIPYNPLGKILGYIVALALVAASFVALPSMTPSAFAAPEAWTPIEPGNIAPLAKVSASGTEVGTTKTPDRVIDGVVPDTATIAADPVNHNAPDASRWSADTTNNSTDKNWIQLDFGAPATVNEIQIYWGNTYGSPFYLETSLDGKTWDRIGGEGKTFQGVKAGKQSIILDEFAADPELRYIKLSTEGKSQKWALSMWEIAVYGQAPEHQGVTGDELFSSLIPYPVSITQDDSEDAAQFVLAPGTAISAPLEASEPAAFLARTLTTATGTEFTVGGSGDGEAGAPTISYVVDPQLTVDDVDEEQMDEAYTLNVTSDQVIITARNATGALWGTQTLLQLFGPWVYFGNATVNSLNPIPAVTIEDGPRFSYRGVGVDPARSFIPVDELKTLMAQMSKYKMNVLHVHLTDDPGWRLEIPNEGKDEGDVIDYSLLTERAGNTAFREGESEWAPEAGRAGFYTLADWREIVESASRLGISVVPEMDGPGHMEAALYSIPELNSELSYPHPCKEFNGDLNAYKQLDPECEEQTAPVPSYKNNIKTTLDATNSHTYAFTKQVLQVITEHSPSPYLHIGGDEANQALISNEHYAEYMGRVLPQVTDLGKRPIIWNDALNTLTAANVDAHTVVQYWNGARDQLTAFARKGGKIIASPADRAYYPQTEDSSLAGPRWACGVSGECNLEQAYRWNPAQLLGVDESAVLGVEGVSWSEHLRSAPDLQSSVGNRMVAHAETGWTQQSQKDWNRFVTAMSAAGSRANTAGFNFHLNTTVDWQIAAAVARGDNRNDAGVFAFDDPSGNALLAYASAPGESVKSLRGTITAENAQGKTFNVPVTYELDTAYHKSDEGRTTGRQMNSVFRAYGDLSTLAAGTYTAKLALSSDALGASELELGSIVITRPQTEAVTVAQWESTETEFPKGSHVFPGNDGVPHQMSWDEHSFMIDGERLAIWAGEFHPWRIPSPQAWRDILQKIKSAGFNAVSFYFFWGMHQSEEGGSFDFEPGTFRDIDLLLTMAEEEGLYVIVRPGPYVNAEISMGGLPAYMTNYWAKLRSTDPQVMEASTRWLEEFNKIAVRHQITNGGGSIILYQVENELLNETDASVAFLKALTEKVKSDGINVPLFENDWGRAGRFAPNKPGTPEGKYGTDFYAYDYYPMGFDCSAARKAITDTEAFFRSVEPKAPQMIAESQGGAFTPWGANYGADDCASYTDANFTRQWTAVRLGNGVKAHTYYMSYGGTNWGYTGSPASGFTSYDYGAAIDEDRTLRNEKYGAQKEEAYLMEANDSYLTAMPVAPPEVKQLSGTDTIKSYQRVASDKTSSVTGNGSRSLSFLLGNTNATQSHDFTFGLDLSKSDGVGEKYSHDSSDKAISYSGGWNEVDSGGAWKGSVMESQTAGETATFTFTGTGIEIITGTGTDHGNLSISIDNRPATTATGYVESNQNKPDQLVVFKEEGMPLASHTVTITNLGEPGAPGAGGTKVQLDAVSVLGAPETSWQTINDSDSAIRYVGTWTHDRAKNWTKNDLFDDEHSSPHAGDYYEYTFSGVGVDVIGPYSSNHGSASIYIDGDFVGKTQEQVTQTAQGQKVLFSYRDLAPGEHTIKVVVDGKPFASSKGSYVALDALRVFPDENSLSEFTTGTSIKDGQYSWAKIPQKAGASLTIHGRDGMVLLADTVIARHNLLYTTSHLFGKPVETDSANLQYLLGVRGDAGETLLEYSQKPDVQVPAGVEVTWNDQYKQLRLNYTYADQPFDIIVKPQGEGAAKALRLRVIDRNYAQGTYLISTGDASSTNRVAVEGVDFARTLIFDGETVHVTGNIDEKSQAPRILLPSGKANATWNASEPGLPGEDGFVEFEPRPLPTVRVPYLAWKAAEETPEAEVDYDDSQWKVITDTVSANPAKQGPAPGSAGGVVLDSNHHGFYEGSVWYRATFTANADNAQISLKATGAGNQYAPRSMDPAFFQVWANGRYLGAKVANGTQQNFTLDGIRAGSEVKLAVLVNNLGQNLDWNDNGFSKDNRGLYSAMLPARDGVVEWRIQGATSIPSVESASERSASVATGVVDPIRGLYNAGGLYGERSGWYLPEYDDSQWVEYDGDMHNTDPGVTWYRANFTLDTPANSDVAYRVEVISSRFNERDRSKRRDHSQATIYVNGWNTGIYIGDVGPQKSFTIPRAFLNMNGANNIAVAVNAKTAEAGPDNIVIRPVHLSYMGPVDALRTVVPPDDGDPSEGETPESSSIPWAELVPATPSGEGTSEGDSPEGASIPWTELVPATPDSEGSSVPWAELVPATPSDEGTSEGDSPEGVSIPWTELIPAAPTAEETAEGISVPWAELVPATPSGEGDSGEAAGSGEGASIPWAELVPATPTSSSAPEGGSSSEGGQPETGETPGDAHDPGSSEGAATTPDTSSDGSSENGSSETSSVPWAEMTPATPSTENPSDGQSIQDGAGESAPDPESLDSGTTDETPANKGAGAANGTPDSAKGGSGSALPQTGAPAIPQLIAAMLALLGVGASLRLRRPKRLGAHSRS